MVELKAFNTVTLPKELYLRVYIHLKYTDKFWI